MWFDCATDITPNSCLQGGITKVSRLNFFGTSRNKSATTAELVFYSFDHGQSIDPKAIPLPFTYEKLILVTFRLYRGTVNIVVQLDTSAMINDRKYKAKVRSLLGWGPARIVRSTIKSQRKYGGRGLPLPLVSTAKAQKAGKRIIARSDEASERFVRASDVSPQPATT
jgi:hypothetical protein